MQAVTTGFLYLFRTLTAQQVLAGSVPSVSSNDGSSPVVIGHPGNEWFWTKSDGFDLTHRDDPTSPLPKTSLKLTTNNSPIIIDAAKTALIIVDMQNIGLSPALGKIQAHRDVAARLVDQTIPAAHKAGMQVVHTTWGLTDKDLKSMDPSSFRMFALGPDGTSLEKPTLGQDLGQITLENGTTVDAGRMLYKGTWNTELWPPLQKEFEESQYLKKPDVRFHKIRLSAFFAGKSDLRDWLRKNGYRTLLFAGVESDACVLISQQEANLAGFDTILLKDVSNTRRGNPDKEVVERMSERIWGFVSTSKELEERVNEAFGDVPRDGPI